jgi:hypothetical protein
MLLELIQRPTVIAMLNAMKSQPSRPVGVYQLHAAQKERRTSSADRLNGRTPAIASAAG